MRSTTRYDGITERAVIRFQKNHGLEPTGKVGKQTVAALNVSARARLAALYANLPRVQEYSRDLADRYLVVNIPAAQLEAVSGGSVYSRHNIIVGKPDRPSPVVIDHHQRPEIQSLLECAGEHR